MGRWLFSVIALLVTATCLSADTDALPLEQDRWLQQQDVPPPSEQWKIIWQRHHDGANYTTAGMSRATGRLIAGTEGDPAQVELIQYEGFYSGEPEWVFPGTEWYVYAAKNADCFVGLDVDTNAETVTVHRWHAGSSTPDWTRHFESSGVVFGPWSLAVTPDGEMVCVIIERHTNPVASRLYCLNGTTGSTVCFDDSPDNFIPVRVACTSTGEYVSHTAVNTDTAQGRFMVVSTSTGDRIWTGTGLSVGTGLAMSQTGDYLAHGRFTLVPPAIEFVLREWRTFPLPGYYVACEHSPLGLALFTFAASWGFEVVASGWVSMQEPPGPSKVKLFTMPSCNPTWTYTCDPGSAPTSTAVTEHGDFVAVGFDGVSELRLFRRASATPAFRASTSSDVMAVDIVTADCGDGAFALACTKFNDLYLVAGGCAVSDVQEGGAGSITPARSLDLAPNPSNSYVRIGYEEPLPEDSKLIVFDLTGRIVRTLALPAGTRSWTWDGNDESGKSVATGAYFIRLKTGDRWATARLQLIH